MPTATLRRPAPSRTFTHDIPIPAALAEALSIRQRDAEVNRLIDKAVGAAPMPGVDVQLSLSVPAGSYPSHLTATEAASDVCRKLAALFSGAAERIAPEKPQKPLRQYQHVA